jgi:hypothetical protein
MNDVLNNNTVANGRKEENCQNKLGIKQIKHKNSLKLHICSTKPFVPNTLYCTTLKKDSMAIEDQDFLLSSILAQRFHPIVR